MGMPRELKNFNVFADGEGYLGKTKEFEEPKLALVTEDWRGGGMIGAVKLDRGLETQTAVITLASHEVALVRYFGTADVGGVPLRQVGAYQADDGSSPEAVEIYISGRFTEIDFGKSTPKDGTEHKYTAAVVTYRRVVNGVTEVDLDMLNGVYEVDGVDRYAEIMAILTN